MTVIKKWRLADADDKKFKAFVWCPSCELRSGIVGHTIDTKGKLSPSFVCPHDGCDFHDNVQLDEYGALEDI